MSKKRLGNIIAKTCLEPAWGHTARFDAKRSLFCNGTDRRLGAIRQRILHALPEASCDRCTDAREHSQDAANKTDFPKSCVGHDKTSHERAEGDADVERGGLDGGSKHECAWMAPACDAHEQRDARDREAIHEQRNKEDGHERKCAIRLAEPERKKGERECEQHRRNGLHARAYIHHARDQVGHDADDAEDEQASILCLARDAQGKPTSVLVAIQDVTDAKAEELRAHIALEDAFKAAEHASQAKSDFLNSMSHDIRTPMNSIMGLTAIAGMHVNDPERVRECLTNITSASRHLLGLINEVLDMAKIESGSIDLAEEPFDLSESIENLITMMNPQIAAKHQELKVVLVDIKHEHVLGDPTRLQQVFVNIMGNSVKFTPEGGMIGLRITELPSSIQSSACYEFVFSDTGCGMSEEFMKRLFEPFSRANDSRTTKVEGTGLGMAIVKSVVSLMSGTIDVESKEGEGTTFTVMVHMKLRDAEQEDLSDLEGIPVLVVDDDEVACEGACILLDDIGMKSEFRLSGPAGIEAVRNRLDNDPYRVVILDWRMPGMSGLEAAKHIREATNEAVPIIILSAYDWSMIEQEARQVGVDAFISKPLFRSRLVQVMKELLVGEMKSVIDEKAMLEELAFQGKRVLLTEDNPMAAEIARELVEMTGAAVEHAENGKLALDMLLAHEPGYYDIVLMDIQMPVMNGHEAAAAIRAQADKRPDMGQIPIVALSADAFAEDVRHARSAGMNDHMSKPLEIETLVRMLKKWVN